MRYYRQFKGKILFQEVSFKVEAQDRWLCNYLYECRMIGYLKRITEYFDMKNKEIKQYFNSMMRGV